MKEKIIENYLKSRLESKGGTCIKFWSAYKGVPDRICLYKDKLAFIELKSSTGRTGALQEYWGDLIKNKHSQEYHLISSKEEVDEFLRGFTDD